LWERYAFTGEDQWVSVVFSFQADDDMHFKVPPAVTGNFNGWVRLVSREVYCVPPPCSDEFGRSPTTGHTDADAQTS